jgi:hypothetical protein
MIQLTVSLSQPGLGVVLGARLLAEFGDNTPLRRPPSLHELRRHPCVPANSARRRPCWPATCTTTGSSTHSAGRRWPRCAPHPARAHDDRLRARGVGHHAALGQLGDRLVALLHGCLTTGTIDDEATRGQSNSKIHKLLLDRKLMGWLDGCQHTRRRTRGPLKAPVDRVTLLVIPTLSGLCRCGRHAPWHNGTGERG